MAVRDQDMGAGCQAVFVEESVDPDVVGNVK